MIKPKRLRPGSRIAVISPSSGLTDLFPDIYELGLNNLEEILGFEIVEYPTARMPQDVLYKNPKLRAQDINDAFSDSSIDGIICSIGGYESVRILPYLDVESIMENPKLLMGFSDATTFLSFLNYKGMVTFYGPSVMAGLAQMKSLPYEFIEHLKYIFFNGQVPYNYKPYSKWTNGYKDWNNLDTLGECTEFFENEGWSFCQGTDAAEGKLWGGCIEVLEFLKCTGYWPDKEFFEDKILFFETSEDKPLPFQVGYMLRNYGMQGIFEKIKGVIFARPKDYSSDECEELKQTVLDILNVEFRNGDIPVVMNVDFGHTDPKIVLPLGCSVRLCPEKNEIILLESPYI